MKNKFKTVGLAACLLVSLSFTGCATDGQTTTVQTATGAVPVSTNLVNVGYEIANFLQQFNTGVSAAIPSVTTFLNQTHNSGDAQTVQLYASLATLASSAVSTGLKAGLPPKQNQAAVNTQLAPANVAAVAASVSATSN